MDSTKAPKNSEFSVIEFFQQITKNIPVKGSKFVVTETYHQIYKLTNSVLQREITNILYYLYNDVVGWEMLNERVFLKQDCALTAMAYTAPHVILSLMELKVPVGFELDFNNLGEGNCPAVVWILFKPRAEYEFDEFGHVFDLLVKQTNDSTLRLGFLPGRQTILHRLINFWEAQFIGTPNPKLLAISTAISSSFHLLLSRADVDGGGGVNLCVTNNEQKTAIQKMQHCLKLSNCLDNNIIDLDYQKALQLWIQAMTALDSATKQTYDYRKAFAPTLNDALESQIIRPLVNLIASYSPAYKFVDANAFR